MNCSDNYLWDIDCQWIDITDIEPGHYTFLVSPGMRAGGCGGTGHGDGDLVDGSGDCGDGDVVGDSGGFDGGDYGYGDVVDGSGDVGDCDAVDDNGD